MRDRDLADSPRASHHDLPSDHVDSLADFVLEPFLTFGGPVPTTMGNFKSVCSGLVKVGVREAEDAGRAEDVGPGMKGLLVKVLRVLAADTDRRTAVRAVCVLRLMGVEGRSFQEIGQEFGLCRAAVQTVYRQIQKAHGGLKSRGDKSDASREACRQRRLGQRKERVDWSTAKLWQNPIPLPLPS
jgi:hypothetical protein